jgi:hypothetical protein
MHSLIPEPLLGETPDQAKSCSCFRIFRKCMHMTDKTRQSSPDIPPNNPATLTLVLSSDTIVLIDWTMTGLWWTRSALPDPALEISPLDSNRFLPPLHPSWQIRASPSRRLDENPVLWLTALLSPSGSMTKSSSAVPWHIKGIKSLLTPLPFTKIHPVPIFNLDEHPLELP